MRRAVPFVALLCLLNSLRGQGMPSQLRNGEWKDAKGNLKTWPDLQTILEKHAEWVYSQKKSGEVAALSGADITHIALASQQLAGAFLEDTHLEGSYMASVGLREAVMTGAHLSRAQLYNADLRGANLSRADLSGTNLAGAYLSGAWLIGTDMRDAVLGYAWIDGVRFEPKVLPPSESIAEARGLEMMTYETNPRPLTDLRKQFQDAGYREQEREITYALNRREAELDKSIERWFKYIAFDLTCQYGLSYGRPLIIVLCLWLVFSISYASFMHRPGPTGIYLVGSRAWRGQSNSQGLLIRLRPVGDAEWWKRPFFWLISEWRVFRIAMFFSLMSAFNIGFRDVNFGRWLRLLTRREYDLKAVGWARTAAGLQSLLSVYLIALWILTYFGRPFG